MAHIITVYMAKGGVGKTTTTLSLGAYLTQRGHKVLLIDTDPQGDLTFQGLGIPKEDVTYTVYEVLLNPTKHPSFAVLHTAIGIDIIPASHQLEGVEKELINEIGREYFLKDALEQIKDEYDYILIDTKPHLGLVTVNAMVASGSVIAPVEVEPYPYADFPQVLTNIKLIQKVNPMLRLGGIVCTQVDKVRNVSEIIEKELRDTYGDLVFETTIPKDVRLAESPASGTPINIYSPNSTGAEAYNKLAQEVEVRYGKE